MPSVVNKQTRAAVTRYLSVMYSHWTDAERKDRKRAILQELAARPVEEHQVYCDKVNAFFARNKPLLEQARRSHADILAEKKRREAQKLLLFPPEQVLLAAKRAGGNINAVQQALLKEED